MAAKQEALRSKDPEGENCEASEFKFCEAKDPKGETGRSPRVNLTRLWGAGVFLEFGIEMAGQVVFAYYFAAWMCWTDS